MVLSKCCVSGHLHTGTARGKIETIASLNTYVTGDGKNVIVILSDVFGIQLTNNLLIADTLAEAGYTVYIPDLFNGDSIPPAALEKGTFDFMTWKARHPNAEKLSIVAAFLKEIRSKTTFIGLIGHCYGAKFVLEQLTSHGLADAGAIAHASQIESSDLHNVSKPVFVTSAETDGSFTVDLRHEAERVFAANKVRYQFALFSGVSHGFAVRGDISDPSVKFAKEKTISDQLCWFDQFN